MKKLYTLPGFDDSCTRKPYQDLKHAAEEKGYTVVCTHIDWTKPLTNQIFPIEPDSVVFGFSLGAVFAWLITQEYPCRHLILGSMTFFRSFHEKEDKEALIDLLGEAFIEDIVKHLTEENRAEKQTRLYGDQEGDDGIADILVTETDHELTRKYIQKVAMLLS